MTAVELEVVDALQHLVAELGVADALLALEPTGHCVLGQHRPHAEVLAQVTEEGQRAHPADPVEVVHHGHAEDRKSTRLNSSHVAISYAGCCLKTKSDQTREAEQL